MTRMTKQDASDRMDQATGHTAAAEEAVKPTRAFWLIRSPRNSMFLAGPRRVCSMQFSTPSAICCAGGAR